MCAPFHMCTPEYQQYLRDHPALKTENQQAVHRQNWEQNSKYNTYSSSNKNKGYTVTSYEKIHSSAKTGQGHLNEYFAKEENDGIRVTAIDDTVADPPSYDWSMVHGESSPARKYNWDTAIEEIKTAEEWNGVAETFENLREQGDLSAAEAEAIIDLFADADANVGTHKLGNIWAPEA